MKPHEKTVNHEKLPSFTTFFYIEILYFELFTVLDTYDRRIGPKQDVLVLQ